MAISRSLMNRQLQADGGIMQVAPREKFGLGSSIKKFVRKIIPNEVAEVAVKAAPFVAPFNPAVAAAMSGIGTFDQTGSIGDSLKGGALTYGLGQGARYLGGAELQGNPFQTGGAFRGGLEGLKAGFSPPLGTQSGFKLGQPVQEVQGIGTTGDASILGEQIASKGRAVNAEQIGLFTEGLTGGNVANASELSYVPNATSALVDASDMALVGDVKQAASQEFNLFKTAAEKVQNFDYREAGNKALELGKKFGKAVFTKPGKDGKPILDKAAVLGAVAFAGSYAEAKALAADAGVEITPEEYDEVTKADKQEEYASYLTNFFGGKKDGGRIGYESGANEMIKTQLLEEIMPETDTSTEEMIMIMTEEGPKMVKKSDLEAMPGMFRDTTTSAYGDAGRGRPVPKFADGGRIGLARGTKPEEAEIGIMAIDVEAGDDEGEEDMKMAYSDVIFNRREKGALFRALGDPRVQQAAADFKDLNNILKNPGMFPEREFMLKEYLKLKGFKDGGRIGYKGGANRVSELLVLRDEKIGKGEDVSDIEAEIFQLTGKTFRSVGGISDIPTGQMRKNNAGVVERDYRDEGGFVPVGIKERADDVPAMLSKNEFVMTADAVRGIGNGSVEEGSKKLYNTMKKAEQVGKA